MPIATGNYPLHGKTTLAALLSIAFWSLTLSPVLASTEDAAAIEARLAETDRFLASDQCEGRGLGSKGIDMAADYLAGDFANSKAKGLGPPFGTAGLSRNSRSGRCHVGAK